MLKIIRYDNYFIFHFISQNTEFMENLNKISKMGLQLYSYISKDYRNKWLLF